eukprot:scaffold62681_cov17-Tisochrysis_lutea.AAC.1
MFPIINLTIQRWHHFNPMQSCFEPVFSLTFPVPWQLNQLQLRERSIELPCQGGGVLVAAVADVAVRQCTAPDRSPIEVGRGCRALQARHSAYQKVWLSVTKANWSNQPFVLDPRSEAGAGACGCDRQRGLRQVNNGGRADQEHAGRWARLSPLK